MTVGIGREISGQRDCGVWMLEFIQIKSILISNLKSF